MKTFKKLTKLKRQAEISSLSKLLSSLSVDSNHKRTSINEDMKSAIQQDDTLKLITLFNEPNSILQNICWNAEMYFMIGKYNLPSSFDILILFPCFEANMEMYNENIFEGIAQSDNNILFTYLLQKYTYNNILTKLSFFIDTHALKCFRVGFNHLCRITTPGEFKDIMKQLLNRNIETLNSGAITTMQQCLQKDGFNFR